MTGSIPVTGWALDDLEVGRVRIVRDPVAGEGPSQVFIADGLFVDGARPDLLTPFPAAPRNTRGGWGYLLLTNFLPNGGNGTFRLHAYAEDVDGHTTLLGSKTITVANSSATLPFGAIDTPAQGETIGGTSYNNFGWVLAPNGPRRRPVVRIRRVAGAVTVYIDGAPVGSPSGMDEPRRLERAVPVVCGYRHGGGCVHVQSFGAERRRPHHRVARHRQHRRCGGYREPLFHRQRRRERCDHSGRHLERHHCRDARERVVTTAIRAEVAGAPLAEEPVAGRRGFDLTAPFRPLAADADGRAVIHGEELDRFELKLGPSHHEGRALAGYLRAGEALTALPVGSSLDDATGTFTWQPGVGFVGAYDLVFVRSENGRAVARQEVRFTLHPKGSNRVGAQVAIDTPATEEQFAAGEQILIAGWAVDLDDTVGTGISAVHVWAYPVQDAGHGTPMFMGLAEYGGHRPDVGVMFGERFARGAYDLVSPGLPPGTYDVAVFAWSTARLAFVPARVVRVTVR